jgi:hypothetical protein
MKHSVFQVVDETPVASGAAQIAELIQGRPELRWAALVDTTFDHDGVAPERAGLNCFGFPELRALSAVAPHLVGIVPGEDLQSRIARLITHCHGRPMLSFVGTSASLEEVANAWRAVHMVSVVDEQKMLLRFSDTRVLSYLPEVLDVSQWTRICGAVSCWAHFDRFARLTIRDVPAGENDPETIQLDGKQLAALLEAAQPDALMALITDQMHDVVPWQRLASERYTMVKDACTLASRFAIDDHADVLALAVAAYLSEGASNADPRLVSLLAQRAWPPGSLGDAIVNAEIV